MFNQFNLNKFMDDVVQFWPQRGERPRGATITWRRQLSTGKVVLTARIKEGSVDLHAIPEAVLSGTRNPVDIIDEFPVDWDLVRAQIAEVTP